MEQPDPGTTAPEEGGPHVLLVSGAGLPEWIWDAVRSELPIPATVARRPDAGSGSLLEHARSILDDVSSPDLVVVAHSVGGAVAAALCHVAPDRVAGVLGVSAVVPAAGRSFLGSLPFPVSLVMRAVIATAGTRPPDKAIRNGLAAGLDASVADAVVRDFEAAPRWLYRDRAPVPSWPPRCGYVSTTRDREVSQRLQAASARRLGARWSTALATGHLPMLEAPDALGRVVLEFAGARAG